MTSGTNAADTWARALLPQFLDLTASRQIEIDIERGNLEAGADPLATAQAIAKIAHKISGTAGSFGFAALGKQSQVIEEISDQICTLSGPALAAAINENLLPALDELSRELDRALASAP
ncbi:MAG: Hpt domain-containing protein [Paracoccaceae bacterium]